MVQMESARDLLPAHVINRELSWLEFNHRVLEEAQSTRNPLLERVKFLLITASNLDEFFMIRVPALWGQTGAALPDGDASGLTAEQLLMMIGSRTHRMCADMYDLFLRALLPELDAQGVCFAEESRLTEAQKEWLDRYFEEQVYPVLTPVTVDATRPFPLLQNARINLGLLIEEENGEALFSNVLVPASLPRLVQVPDAQRVLLMPIEQVISRSLQRLFYGRRILCQAAYRITRNSDLSFSDDEAESLLSEVEKSLKKRRLGSAVRLEIDRRADAQLLSRLERELKLQEGETYLIHGPIDLAGLLRAVYALDGFESLRYPPFTPRRLSLGESETMFDRIRKGDLLLYHPYDDFSAVVRFIQEAARDPQVLAIKQTLYRVGSQSPIMSALVEAAEAGKQVTVLLEVKARFDEANNMHWGRRLERAGAQVLYGVVGLKTHSKITLVVRREGDALRRYVHLGTGNYNEATGAAYTDHSLFTARPAFGDDASAFFNRLSGYTGLPPLHKLVCAPHDLRRFFLEKIDQEAANARAGKKADIFAKMNSLVDTEIIAALYRASMAGVRIRLMVRGICCLRPGLPGLSENIQVHSLVGRFLEHSRIYGFENDGKHLVYLSSADWMPRNFDRRIELLFPVEDPALAAQAMAVLKLQWRDNTQGRELLSNGQYRALSPAENGQAVDAQRELLARSPAEL